MVTGMKRSLADERSQTTNEQDRAIILGDIGIKHQKKSPSMLQTVDDNDDLGDGGNRDDYDHREYDQAVNDGLSGDHEGGGKAETHAEEEDEEETQKDEDEVENEEEDEEAEEDDADVDADVAAINQNGNAVHPGEQLDPPQRHLPVRMKSDWIATGARQEKCRVGSCDRLTIYMCLGCNVPMCCELPQKNPRPSVNPISCFFRLHNTTVDNTKNIPIRPDQAKKRHVRGEIVPASLPPADLLFV
jgi:hypothetical protein